MNNPITPLPQEGQRWAHAATNTNYEIVGIGYPYNDADAALPHVIYRSFDTGFIRFRTLEEFERKFIPAG